MRTVLLTALFLAAVAPAQAQPPLGTRDASYAVVQYMRHFWPGVDYTARCHQRRCHIAGTKRRGLPQLKFDVVIRSARNGYVVEDEFPTTRPLVLHVRPL